MINKTAFRQSMILFTAALIWDFTFAAQSVGMDYVGPYTFLYKQIHMVYHFWLIGTRLDAIQLLIGLTNYNTFPKRYILKTGTPGICPAISDIHPRVLPPRHLRFV